MKRVRRPGIQLLFFLYNIPHVHHFVRLVWRLLRDTRVSKLLKGLLLLALLYVISPYDFIPEALFLWFGLIDDVAILSAAIGLFIRWSPPEVVAEYVATFDMRFQQHFQRWHTVTWRD